MWTVLHKKLHSHLIFFKYYFCNLFFNPYLHSKILAINFLRTGVTVTAAVATDILSLIFLFPVGHSAQFVGLCEDVCFTASAASRCRRPLIWTEYGSCNSLKTAFTLMQEQVPLATPAKLSLCHTRVQHKDTKKYCFKDHLVQMILNWRNRRWKMSIARFHGVTKNPYSFEQQNVYSVNYLNYLVAVLASRCFDSANDVGA